MTNTLELLKSLEGKGRPNDAREKLASLEGRLAPKKPEQRTLMKPFKQEELDKVQSNLTAFKPKQEQLNRNPVDTFLSALNPLSKGGMVEQMGNVLNLGKTGAEIGYGMVKDTTIDPIIKSPVAQTAFNRNVKTGNPILDFFKMGLSEGGKFISSRAGAVPQGATNVISFLEDTGMFLTGGNLGKGKGLSSLMGQVTEPIQKEVEQLGTDITGVPSESVAGTLGRFTGELRGGGTGLVGAGIAAKGSVQGLKFLASLVGKIPLPKKLVDALSATNLLKGVGNVAETAGYSIGAKGTQLAKEALSAVPGIVKAGAKTGVGAAKMGAKVAGASGYMAAKGAKGLATGIAEEAGLGGGLRSMLNATEAGIEGAVKVGANALKNVKPTFQTAWEGIVQAAKEGGKAKLNELTPVVEKISSYVDDLISGSNSGSAGRTAVGAVDDVIGQTASDISSSGRGAAIGATDDLISKAGQEARQSENVFQETIAKAKEATAQGAKSGAAEIKTPNDFFDALKQLSKKISEKDAILLGNVIKENHAITPEIIVGLLNDITRDLPSAARMVQNSLKSTATVYASSGQVPEPEDFFYNLVFDALLGKTGGYLKNRMVSKVQKVSQERGVTRLYPSERSAAFTNDVFMKMYELGLVKDKPQTMLNRANDKRKFLLKEEQKLFDQLTGETIEGGKIIEPSTKTLTGLVQQGDLGMAQTYANKLNDFLKGQIPELAEKINKLSGKRNGVITLQNKLGKLESYGRPESIKIANSKITALQRDIGSLEKEILDEIANLPNTVNKVFAAEELRDIIKIGNKANRNIVAGRAVASETAVAHKSVKYDLMSGAQHALKSKHPAFAVWGKNMQAVYLAEMFAEQLLKSARPPKGTRLGGWEPMLYNILPFASKMTKKTGIKETVQQGSAMGADVIKGLQSLFTP